jgi:hypothetical protein
LSYKLAAGYFETIFYFTLIIGQKIEAVQMPVGFFCLMVPANFIKWLGKQKSLAVL